MAITRYCTETDITRRWSTYGLSQLSQHTEVSDNSTDSDVINHSIDYASGFEIDARVLNRGYSQANLALSGTVNMICIELALCHLVTTRGNPVPADQEKICNDIREYLTQVGNGSKNLPGVPFSKKTYPSVQNFRVDRRWPATKVRRLDSSSTQNESVLQRLDAIYDDW